MYQFDFHDIAGPKITFHAANISILSEFQILRLSHVSLCRTQKVIYIMSLYVTSLFYSGLLRVSMWPISTSNVYEEIQIVR
jgi:hypothetical protein